MLGKFFILEVLQNELVFVIPLLQGEVCKMNNLLKLDEVEIDPIFRVMRVADWQQAIKLEPQFWKILRYAAQSENIRLSEYIKLILSDREHKNKTAYLRAYALSWLFSKYRYLHNMVRANTVVKELHLSPIPSITVTRGCRLFSCNAEFMEIIKQSAAASTEAGSTIKDAVIAFDYPIEKIFEYLDGSSTASTECEYKIVFDKDTYQYRARAALVPIIDKNLLILYNLPKKPS